MKLDAAEGLALRLMARHGIPHWHLIWKDWTLYAGEVVRDYNWILLSRPYVEINPRRVVREIILHEIAHALTTGHHDEAWREVFRRIGGSGRDNLAYVVTPTADITEEEAKMVLIAFTEGRLTRGRLDDEQRDAAAPR